MIHKVTFYDYMHNCKVCYCFGTLQQVRNWVNDLPDANDILIVPQNDMVLVKPTGFITLVDCTL